MSFIEMKIAWALSVAFLFIFNVSNFFFIAIFLKHAMFYLSLPAWH